MGEPAAADLRVAVLGLGEAGATIAADLVAAGANVQGFDPDPGRHVSGVRAAATAADAVRGTDVVLSVTPGPDAVEAARSTASALAPRQLYGDLSTAGPATKVAAAEVVAGAGALFADVALLAPVPGRGLSTPALASGPGAEVLAGRLRELGMTVEVVGDEPGQAASRKLLRSVFMKGLAAAALESLTAARAAGCEEWLRAQIAEALTAADANLLERLVTGSRLHAARRVDEMEAAAELLRDLGVEPRVADAAAATLAELAGANQGAGDSAPSHAAPRAWTASSPGVSPGSSG